MEVQPTKSASNTTKKSEDMSEKEKKYVTVLKELGLENNCTVEAYLRAYVNHLAAELEDKVERQVQAFQNRFEEIRKEMEEDSADEEEEEVEEQKEDNDDKKQIILTKRKKQKRQKRKERKRRRRRRRNIPNLYLDVSRTVQWKEICDSTSSARCKVLIGRSSGKKFRKSGVAFERS